MPEATEVSAPRYSEMRQLSSLINANKPSLESAEDYEKKDYFSSKEKALSAVLPGYAILPEAYHSVFVKTLEIYFRNSFDRVLAEIKDIRNPYQIPYRDWCDSIQQRSEGYLKPAPFCRAGWILNQELE